MKQIELNGVSISYQIAFKKNKNTYFYFQKDGTIKINASRYQSEKEIISYMKQNASQFLQKSKKATKETHFEDGYYYYLNTPLKIEHFDQLKVIKDFNTNTIYIPHKSIDQDSTILRKQERNDLLKEVKKIVEKYRNNPYIDISGIKVKTRHTRSRFGSCNSVKRTINLNTNLIHYDIKYMDYVFAHEITHLVVQNHGKEFYKLLEKLYPNYKEVRQELRNIYR